MNALRRTVFGTPAARGMAYQVSTSRKADLNAIKDKLKVFKSGDIYLTKDDSTGIARLAIDHIEKRNSLSGYMMVRLAEAVDELEGWKAGKGLIVHGSGGYFCSGGDLDFVKQINTPDEGFEMACLMHDTLTRLGRLPLVSVSFVEGKAIGGGAEMTTATDYRLFTSDAQVQFVHLRLGLVPGWGGTTRLVRLLGRRNALSIILNATKIDHAHPHNMVDGAAADVLEAEQWLLQMVGPYDPKVIGAIKNTVMGAEVLDIDDSLLYERVMFRGVWGGTANKKALKEGIKHR